MTHKEVEKFILSLPNAVLDYPFGEDVAVYKVFVSSVHPVASQVEGGQGDNEKRASRAGGTVSEFRKQSTQQSATSTAGIAGFASEQGSAVRGEWKMFALIREGIDPVSISLKCDPQLAEVLRNKYETVMPGYHLNKKHWNTIVLTGQLPWEEVKGLIHHSYDLVAGNKNAIPTTD